MSARTVMLVATFLCLFCGLGEADFQYKQSGQFTTGVAQVKAALGTQATEATVYVQGAFLRIDLPVGTYGIIDLDARRGNACVLNPSRLSPSLGLWKGGRNLIPLSGDHDHPPSKVTSRQLRARLPFLALLR